MRNNELIMKYLSYQRHSLRVKNYANSFLLNTSLSVCRHSHSRWCRRNSYREYIFLWQFLKTRLSTSSTHDLRNPTHTLALLSYCIPQLMIKRTIYKELIDQAGSINVFYIEMVWLPKMCLTNARIIYAVGTLLALIIIFTIWKVAYWWLYQFNIKFYLTLLWPILNEMRCKYYLEYHSYWFDMKSQQ